MEPEIQKQEEDNGNPTKSAGGDEPSTVISTRNEESEIQSGEDGNSRPKTDVPDERFEKKDSVIDVKQGGGSFSTGEGLREEKVCRICHMDSENPSENPELIQLGCGCKDELGVSHRHCAETWFNHKGNRECEICGKTAKNVTGIQETRIVMVEWNETRLMTGRAANPSGTEGGSCRCNPSFCNFLLGCLVLAFILPWFFRVDML